MIASQVGRHDVAVDLIGRAIALDRAARSTIATTASRWPAETLRGGDRELRPRFVTASGGEALFNRGVALQVLGRFAQALESYDRLLETSAGHASALCNRGLVLEQLKRPDDALTSYDRALATQPNFVEALCNRGNLLKQVGRLAEALANYDRALAYIPTTPRRSTTAATTRCAGRPHDALEPYERALLARPDYVEALCNHGAALAALGRNDEALASYDRALAVAPDFSEALSNRGNALKALGRSTKRW